MSACYVCCESVTDATRLNRLIHKASDVGVELDSDSAVRLLLLQIFAS